MPLVMSMSANRTSSGGAPGTRPCAHASKTNVSLGQGEYAIRSGCPSVSRAASVSVRGLMWVPTLQYGRELPECVGECREGLAEAPGGAVARADGVGHRAQLKDGHPVRGGRLGHPEPLHRLGEGERMARPQL